MSNLSPGPWVFAFGRGATLCDGDGKALLSVLPGAAWNLTVADKLAIQKVPEMVAMLRKLEWAGMEASYDGPREPVCPECGAFNRQRGGAPSPGFGMHEHDCSLAALLKDLPEGP